MDNLSTKQLKIPFQKRMKIGLLMGAPTDSIFQAPMMQALQNTYTSAEPSPQQGIKIGGKSNLADAEMTKLQKQEDDENTDD